jgi:hypothetical protein
MCRIRQPEHCPEYGSFLKFGECGEGFCPKCKNYVMALEIDLVGK